MLAMGGSALGGWQAQAAVGPWRSLLTTAGEAVKSSGLLLSIAIAIKQLVADMDLWTVTLIFCACVLVCTTFISHTVGAMVILPIVQSVGESMPGHPHPKLLIMASALMCSGQCAAAGSGRLWWAQIDP